MLQAPKMLASFQDFVVFWAIKNTGISRMFVLGAPQNAEFFPRRLCFKRFKMLEFPGFLCLRRFSLQAVCLSMLISKVFGVWGA